MNSLYSFFFSIKAVPCENVAFKSQNLIHVVEDVLKYGYCLTWKYYLELQFIHYKL